MREVVLFERVIKFVNKKNKKKINPWRIEGGHDEKLFVENNLNKHIVKQEELKY